jgi:hypothetical protein
MKYETGNFLSCVFRHQRLFVAVFMISDMRCCLCKYTYRRRLKMHYYGELAISYCLVNITA